MAGFDPKQMIKLSNVQALDSVSTTKQRFFYNAVPGGDAKAAVVAAGYFNAHRKYLQVGDLIEVVATGGFTFVQVAAVPAVGNVTTAALAYV